MQIFYEIQRKAVLSVISRSDWVLSCASWIGGGTSAVFLLISLVLASLVPWYLDYLIVDLFFPVDWGCQDQCKFRVLGTIICRRCSWALETVSLWLAVLHGARFCPGSASRRLTLTALPLGWSCRYGHLGWWFEWSSCCFLTSLSQVLQVGLLFGWLMWWLQVYPVTCSCLQSCSWEENFVGTVVPQVP